MDIPSDRIRSGGPFVVSFRRIPLAVMFSGTSRACRDCVLRLAARVSGPRKARFDGLEEGDGEKSGAEESLMPDSRGFADEVCRLRKLRNASESQ